MKTNLEMKLHLKIISQQNSIFKTFVNYDFIKSKYIKMLKGKRYKVQIEFQIDIQNSCNLSCNFCKFEL